MADKITLLYAHHRARMTKVWRADGSISDYDKAYEYGVEERELLDLRSLATVLDEVAGEPSVCAIRGCYEPVPVGVSVVRTIDSTVDRPHHWFMLDVDRYEPLLADPVADPLGAIHELLETHLPELIGASFYWQLSPSAGHAKNAGKLKCHLFFWSDTAYDSETMSAWARTKLYVDSVVMRQVQPMFIAAPVFEPGIQDPVAVRSGFEDGVFGDTVDLRIDPSVVDQAAQRRRKGRQDMVDPTTKPGVVGAFCRLYSPTRVIEEVLPDLFEFGAGSDYRITWALGGGAPEGVAITDDGLHLYNSHHTDPFGGRAVNVWDFVRQHRFGHLDSDELEALDTTTSPSQRAMFAWASSLPDVADEKEDRAAQEVEELAERIEAQAAQPPGTALTPQQEAWSEKADRFARALSLITRCGNAEQLKSEVVQRLQAATFDDVERETLAVELRARLTELTGIRTPIGACRKMLRPFTSGIFKHVNDDGVPLTTQENVAQVIDEVGAEVRYNLIRRRIDISIPDVKTLHDTKNSAMMTRLTSYCIEHGMAAFTTLIQAYVRAIASENAYNPVMDWIDSAPWDGVDRLQALYETVTVDPGKESYRNLVMLKWLLSAVAIANNDDGRTMARGVLVFQGRQYMGKTQWLRSLVPADSDWIHTGAALKAGDRDSEKKLTSFWLVEFGELGSTFNRSDADALKAFISQTDDVMRLAYAVAEDEFRRRTAFFASVNDAEFLRDPTGETRFWVLAVLAVNQDHGLNLQQLWAQVATLWRFGEPHWLSPQEMALVEASNVDFKETNPVDDLVNTRLLWEADKGELVWETVTQVAQRIGYQKPTQKETNAVGAALRRKGVSRKRSVYGGWLYQIRIDDPLE